MMLPATFASLFLAASAALLAMPAAVAAPLAGPLSLGEADAAPVVQVQQSQPRQPRRTNPTRRAYRNDGSRSPWDSYGSYGYGSGSPYGYGSGSAYGDYGRGCVHGSPSETSAYPSWMVCHGR
jgi:hypothetical protein